MKRRIGSQIRREVPKHAPSGRDYQRAFSLNDNMNPGAYESASAAAIMNGPRHGQPPAQPALSSFEAAALAQRGPMGYYPAASQAPAPAVAGIGSAGGNYPYGAPAAASSPNSSGQPMMQQHQRQSPGHSAVPVGAGTSAAMGVPPGMHAQGNLGSGHVSQYKSRTELEAARKEEERINAERAQARYITRHRSRSLPLSRIMYCSRLALACLLLH